MSFRSMRDNSSFFQEYDGATLPVSFYMLKGIEIFREMLLACNRAACSIMARRRHPNSFTIRATSALLSGETQIPSISERRRQSLMVFSSLRTLISSAGIASAFEFLIAWCQSAVSGIIDDRNILNKTSQFA